MNELSDIGTSSRGWSWNKGHLFILFVVEVKGKILALILMQTE